MCLFYFVNENVFFPNCSYFRSFLNYYNLGAQPVSFVTMTTMWSISQKMTLLERVRLPNARPTMAAVAVAAGRKMAANAEAPEESPSKEPKPAGFSNRERFRTAFRMRASTLRQSSEGTAGKKSAAGALIVIGVASITAMKCCGRCSGTCGGGHGGAWLPARHPVGGDDPHAQVSHQGRQVCPEPAACPSCVLGQQR